MYDPHVGLVMKKNCATTQISLFRRSSSTKFGKCATFTFVCLFEGLNRCSNHLAKFLKVLSMIYGLLQADRTATKRDLYYRDPKVFLEKKILSKFITIIVIFLSLQLFESQTSIDHIIDDIGCMLDVPRHMLNVVATSKGCLAGDLIISCEDDEILDCSETISVKFQFPT